MVRDLIIRSFLGSNVIASRFFFGNPLLMPVSDNDEDGDEEEERDEDGDEEEERDEDDDEDDDNEDFEESFFGKYTSQG